MRQTISGLAAAIAVVAAGAAPALACGAGFAGSCSQGYYGAGYDYSAYYGVAGYERLPDPSPQYYASPQYYYVNQGPSYTGPGMFAPLPTYQESAVSGWGAYNHNYYYGYDGGPYGNATNHYYDGAPAIEGPAIYGYRSRPHFRPWHSRIYTYNYRSPRYGAYRFAGPRYPGHRERVLRRSY